MSRQVAREVSPVNVMASARQDICEAKSDGTGEPQAISASSSSCLMIWFGTLGYLKFANANADEFFDAFARIALIPDEQIFMGANSTN